MSQQRCRQEWKGKEKRYDMQQRSPNWNGTRALMLYGMSLNSSGTKTYQKKIFFFWIVSRVFEEIHFKKHWEPSSNPLNPPPAHRIKTTTNSVVRNRCHIRTPKDNDSHFDCLCVSSPCSMWHKLLPCVSYVIPFPCTPVNLCVCVCLGCERVALLSLSWHKQDAPKIPFSVVKLGGREQDHHWMIKNQKLFNHHFTSKNEI